MKSECNQTVNSAEDS